MARRKTNGKMTKDISQLGTRERILAVARRLVDRGGEVAATITSVAEGAGISRQAVYLHFSDRSQLLLALSDYIDEELGLGDWMEQIEALQDGEEMLSLLALTRAQRSVGLASLVRSIDGDRFRDDAASSAWMHRHQANVDWMESVIVHQLMSEKRIHPSWRSREAAAFLVMLFSLRNWDDLTQACGWLPERYVGIIAAGALAALAGPVQLMRKRQKKVPRHPATGSDIGVKPTKRGAGWHSKASGRRG